MNRSIDHKDLQNAFSQAEKKHSIDTKDDYYYVVNGPAYTDFSPRTIKEVKKETILPALKNLADKIYDFIHSEEKIDSKKFDLWHEETCKKFIEEYKSSTKKEIKFGKAQKIVNMTFKYLFCFDDSMNHKEKFEHCHMPLDTYTLEWFTDNVVKQYNKDNKNEKVKTTTIKEKSWGNLDFGEKNERYSYSWIQNEIKVFLNKSNQYIDANGKPLSPFFAEFYIWPEQKWKRFFKPFESLNIIKNKDYPSYSNEELSKQIKKLYKTIGDIKTKFD